MIQDMKKLTFLITNGEYDKFIADIRELGVIHVEELQQGATSDELQAGLDLAVRYKEALKALDFAVDSYESNTTYTPQPADASKGVALVDTVERLLQEENSVKHSIDATEDAIRQLEPFGEFSWDTIRQLEKSGYKPYFYAVNAKMYKAEWGEKYFATAVNEINKKTYFVAFSNEDKEPEITAERLFLPEESLSVYQEKCKVLNEQLASIHEQMLQVNAVDRASIEAGQTANENDIQLSKVHLSNENLVDGAVKLMVGWTLKENADRVVDYLEKEHIFYEMADPAFEDNVPIQIKNDKFSSLFEPILRMYSLPNYHDIDPLPFFAPFFMLFFGLCMGDMGYGLLILAASIAIIFAKPNIASYGKLGALLGGMTCICGFITGTLGVHQAHPAILHQRLDEGQLLWLLAYDGHFRHHRSHSGVAWHDAGWLQGCEELRLRLWCGQVFVGGGAAECHDSVRLATLRRRTLSACAVCALCSHCPVCPRHLLPQQSQCLQEGFRSWQGAGCGKQLGWRHLGNLRHVHRSAG